MSHHHHKKHHDHFKHHEANHKHRNKTHDKGALANLNTQISAVLTNYKFDEHAEHPTEALAAWSHMLDGNKRFAAGNLTEYILHLAHEIDPKRRNELGLGQHPYAVVLTCSDSRVSPELIFDQGLGEMFVVRTAGNVPDKVALGSIEYGLLHLKAPLLVVLGHTKCGAVTATLDFESAKGHVEGGNDHIQNIVEEIKPSASAALTKYGVETHPKCLFSAVKRNARAVGKNLPKLSQPIQQLVTSGTVKVVTAVYDIDTGLVREV